MASNDDYYKFLDVSPTASQKEIRSAFRSMAFKYHPDHNKDPWAETIFKQINEAYQVLGNPAKRAAYDEERRAQARRAEESQRAAREGRHYRERSGARGSGYEGSGYRDSGVIICPYCGQPNYSFNRFCSNCRRELGRDAYGRRGSSDPSSSYYDAESTAPAISNHLGKAILATLFCFAPTGIVSIAFAARVNGKLRKGDIQGALRCSRKANIWACVSIVLGIPFFSFSVLGFIIGFAG